jgi:hypothetical protein
MAEGDWVKAELPTNPGPLYLMLGSVGYQWRSHVTAASRVEVFIWPKGEGEPPGIPA